MVCHGLGKVKSNCRYYKSTWAWPVFESLCGFLAWERIRSPFSVRVLAQAGLFEPSLQTWGGGGQCEWLTVGRQWLPHCPLRGSVSRFHLSPPPPGHCAYLSTQRAAWHLFEKQMLRIHHILGPEALG